MFAEREDLVTQECADNDTNCGDIENGGGELRNVVREDRGAEFRVENIWQVARKGEENRCGSPVKMILEKGKNGGEFFHSRNLFAVPKIECDEWKIGDTPSPTAELFVLVFEGADVGF